MAQAVPSLPAQTVCFSREAHPTPALGTRSAKPSEATLLGNGGSGGDLRPGHTRNESEVCFTLRPWRLCVENSGSVGVLLLATRDALTLCVPSSPAPVGTPRPLAVCRPLRGAGRPSWFDGGRGSPAGRAGWSARSAGSAGRSGTADGCRGGVGGVTRGCSGLGPPDWAPRLLVGGHALPPCVGGFRLSPGNLRRHGGQARLFPLPRLRSAAVSPCG